MADELSDVEVKTTRVRATRRRRMRPCVVSLSGVDGSGKSTLATTLLEEFSDRGLRATRVWSRPGCGLDLIEPLLARGKRAFASDPRTGSRRMADPQASTPATRRGLAGWSWSLVVTIAYLWHARREHARAAGIVVGDRHLLDALVSLDFYYGRHARTLQARLVRWFLPRADLAYYLDANPALILGRQPESSTGPHAVEQQLERYGTLLHEHRPRRLDAEAEVEVLADEIARDVSEHLRASFTDR